VPVRSHSVGVVLGAAVIVTSDVVTLIDPCESTKGRKSSAKKIEAPILDHMEPRNSSGLTEKWM
jgi:hypothetical protein